MKNKEPKKIGRIGYVFTIIFLMIFVFIFFAVIGFVFNNEDLMGLAILFLLVVTFIFLFKVTRNRLSDINLPKGLSFVLLIPSVNVVFVMILCFLPSDLITTNKDQNKSNRNKKVYKDTRHHNESSNRPKNYKRAKPMEPRRKQEVINHETVGTLRTQPESRQSLENIIEQIHKQPVRESEKELTNIQQVVKDEDKPIKRKPDVRPKAQAVKAKGNTNMNTISLEDFINITGINRERATQIIKARDKAGRLLSAYDLSLRFDISPEERKKIETKLEFRL